MSKRPVIGVIPLIDYNKKSYWMLPGYFGGIIEAGGLPVMLPLASDIKVIEQIVSMCDGFIFTGGQDVEPKLYSEKKSVPAVSEVPKEMLWRCFFLIT